METNKAQHAAEHVDQQLMSFLAPAEKQLNEFFYDKAPRLPKGLCEFLVMIAPYVSIIGAIFGAIAILAMLGVSAIGVPLFLFAAPAYAFNYWIYAGATIVGWLLGIAAIPGLFARSKQGWNFMFYGALWSGIIQLISMNLFGLIIGLLISFYFLFQLRPYYMHALTAPKA